MHATVSPDTAPEPAQLPVHQLEGQQHYLRALTDMAGHCQVLAQKALYNDRGVKLLEQGARVDSSLYDRLIQHKLSEPIDEQLSVQGMVSVESVRQQAREQCRQDPLLQRLLAMPQGPGESLLLAPVRALVLPHTLALRLTVLREQHPVRYQHSLRVMLVCLYLACKSGLRERDLPALAAAALLHDIGVLHLDPVWHDPGQRISGAGRKALMVHPITAAVVIQAQKAYPASVSQAVLEHHERMDGSGYPRGLMGERISPMGQILLLAEVATAFFEKYAHQSAALRLSLMLRMGHRKFPAALVAWLLPVLSHGSEVGDMQATPTQVQELIDLLSHSFADWDRRCIALAPEAFAPQGGMACAFVTQGLIALQKTLFEAGSHPQQQAEALAYLEGDPEGLAELLLLGREALWQLQSLIDGLQSRWPRLQTSADPADQAAAQWGEDFSARIAAMAQMPAA